MKIIQLKTEQTDKPLIEMLRERGIDVPAYCGGKGTCGKCKVKLADGWHLACKTFVTGDIEVGVPETAIEEMLIETEYDLKEQKEIKLAKNAEDFNQNLAALDIGTTTLAIAKIDQLTGETDAVAMVANSQRMFGADVISRIQASNEGKSDILKELIRKDIENLLEKLDMPIDKTRLIVSCNTAMGHILQGYSCKSLGTAPYEPIDISYHEFENMTMLPGISTFVGADIVSGIIACGMNQSKKISILVDIGTNGEMVIGNKDRLLVTSTAAGPALEGGNISCGVPSIQGAICSADIQNEDIIFETIGGSEPKGICGTGIIDIIYELLNNKLIASSGLLCEKYFETGFPLTEKMSFTQKDIREVQYAKAAIRTGIEILIKEFGVAYNQIDKVYLAGGFGKNLNAEKAVGIGLLPQELREKITAVGNSSLAGAVMAARDERISPEMTDVANRAEEILLAEQEAFQEMYLNYMYFPEQK